MPLSKIEQGQTMRLSRSSLSKIIVINIAIAALTGCNDSSDATDENNTQLTPRFIQTQMGMDMPMGMQAPDEMLLQDMNTSLEWINGNNGIDGVPSGLASIPEGTLRSDALDEAFLFCENVTFATHADWRVPTALEAQDMIQLASLDEFAPVYADDLIPQIIGYTDGLSDVKTITTRNKPPKGVLQEWADEKTDVKCVRSFISMEMMQQMLDMMQDMADNNIPRFEQVDMGMDMPMDMRAPNEMMLRDAMTNLEWTDGNNELPAVNSGLSTVNAATVEEAQTFCADLTFATHDDWRLPSAWEAEEMVKATLMMGITPVYSNIDSDYLAATGRDDTHHVRVNTHNRPPEGETGLLDVEIGLEVKCVRTFLPMMPVSDTDTGSTMMQ